MTAPYLNCDGCRGTAGRAGCPTHGGETWAANIVFHRGTASARDDLLLLIADCLVTLAWEASPDGGWRQLRLEALRAALAGGSE